MSSILSANFTRPQAVVRLKANLFGLFITFCVRYIFSPYIVLRRTLIEAGRHSQRFVYLFGALQAQSSYVELMVEFAVIAVLAANALQAFYYVQYPAPAPRVVSTTSITPARPSSPLVSWALVIPAVDYRCRYLSDGSR